MAKSEKPTNGLKRLEEKLTEFAKYPSFPAYLRDNFDAFSKTIGRGGPSKWDAIANWAMEEKLTGGKVITPATAKRAYEREKARRDKQPKKVTPQSLASTPSPRIVAPAPADPPPQTRTTAEAQTEIARVRREMRIRSGLKPEED